MGDKHHAQQSRGFNILSSFAQMSVGSKGMTITHEQIDDPASVMSQNDSDSAENQRIQIINGIFKYSKHIKVLVEDFNSKI